MADRAPSITDLIPSSRLARYRAVVGDDGDALERFYQWSQQLSLSVFADIAVLEVAMRSAMARELTSTFGHDWFRRADLFDDDAARAIATGWSQGGLASLERAGAGAGALEGKLVASMTFGFWIKLLGRGSFAGRPPQRRRRIYDELLWKPALHAAFPNAPTRGAVERRGAVVRTARNRVAHHEHIAWGVPLPGQGVRLRVGTVHERLLELAAFIDPQLATWIEARSALPAHISECPVEPDALLL